MITTEELEKIIDSGCSYMISQKTVNDWQQQHWYHNIAPPHDAENCQECRVDRKINR